MIKFLRKEGKCPEKWVREEEIARQFSEAMRAIKLDAEVLEWVVTALKESHADEKKYHAVMLYEKQPTRESAESSIFRTRIRFGRTVAFSRTTGKNHDMLMKRNSAYKKEMVAFQTKNDHIDFWLPTVDALRNHFCGPTLAIREAMIVAQTQVKDGFLEKVHDEG